MKHMHNIPQEAHVERVRQVLEAWRNVDMSSQPAMTRVLLAGLRDRYGDLNRAVNKASALLDEFEAVASGFYAVLDEADAIIDQVTPPSGA